MSFETLRQTLELAMSTGWTLTPVAYENVRFDMPSTAWVMFTIVCGEGRTYAIDGSTKYARDNGLVSCQVYVPEFIGTKQSKQLVDAFNAIFEMKAFAGSLHTDIASVKTLGAIDGWHQTSVTIPYRRNRNV